MKSSKTRQTLTVKAIIFVIISIILMIIDSQGNYLKTARSHLLTFVYPIQYIVDFPVKTGQWLSTAANSHLQLLNENGQLREHNLRLQFALQKFEDLQQENERLRQLLNAALQLPKERVEIAEVLAVDLGEFKRKILINKGEKHGVFINQPVVDAQGIMGQVVQISQFSSIVMLITDADHELPVQVVRTGLRTVVKGMGKVNRLSLLYLSHVGLSTGIKVGDLVVTSGTGKNFPKGYPVATVIEVNPDIAQAYAQVQAEPRAILERNREVLLIWNRE